MLALRDVIISFQANFVPALIVTEGGPRLATFFLPLYVYRRGFPLRTVGIRGRGDSHDVRDHGGRGVRPVPSRAPLEARLEGEAQSSRASAATSSTSPHLQQNALVGSRVSRHQMVVVSQFEQWWILLTIGVTVARPVLLVLPLLVVRRFLPAWTTCKPTRLHGSKRWHRVHD